MTRQEFSAKTRAQAFERQSGRCTHCGVQLTPGNVEYDHRITCEQGGDNSLENCDPVCRNCHKGKTRSDATIAAKGRSVRRRAYGGTPRSAVPGSRASRWKRKLDGTIVLREEDGPAKMR